MSIHIIKEVLISKIRKFLVPRVSIENVNIVQSEAEVEEPPT
jgi:hypothetical protein